MLIALAIGEIADDLRWQARAKTSNRAMDQELARAAGVLDERVMMQACLDHRVEEADRIVRIARRTGTLPDIIGFGRPAVRPLQTSAWDDAVASGVLLHLNSERRSILSINYPVIKARIEANPHEYSRWATLQVLKDAPGPASDTLLTEAAINIAKLRFENVLSGAIARQTRDKLIASGIVPSYYLILDREGTRAEVAADIRASGLCRRSIVR